MSSSSATSLRLAIGPLRYLLVAHDAWGRAVLSSLSAGVDCVPFATPPDRVLHLLEFRPSELEWQEIRSCSVPHRLAEVLPADVPTRGWELASDDTGGCCWQHKDTSQTLWTQGLTTPRFSPAFQLPWEPLQADISHRGGSVIHAGLVLLGDASYLLTAPPGGGKTTALSQLPRTWRVQSDDAALIWPAEHSGFLASPLPTWGVLIRGSTALPGVQPWRIAETSPVAGVALLQKSDRVRLARLTPIESAQHLYRALCEHPRIVSVRHRFRRQAFRTASELARAVPAWRLELTGQGDFWTPLARAFASA
jgi:SynChlorMet cassette protein ScmC